jgi:S-methylmethionine-dependent homocysteine/selenocysteine methylase
MLIRETNRRKPMTKYRNALPQLSGQQFITDGGLETTLVFHDGIDLPNFAAFDLLRTADGVQRLDDYYRRYAGIATENEVGFVLESVTWRASSDWGQLMGYSDIALDAINKQSIEMLEVLRDELETENSPMVISGCVGPRGDGYNPDFFMSAEQAQAYHSAQIKSLSETGADMVTAMTITYVEEAIGIVLAARAENIPVVISFTVETDGRLPSGQTLKDAIDQVDEATGSTPAYYMINCAHPEHFESTLLGDERWLSRIQGIRANASNKSHAELDECEELDDGNPHELGQSYKAFKKQLTQLNVFGGCCGTDHRHVEAICRATTMD